MKIFINSTLEWNTPEIILLWFFSSLPKHCVLWGLFFPNDFFEVDISHNTEINYYVFLIFFQFLKIAVSAFPHNCQTVSFHAFLSSLIYTQAI